MPEPISESDLSREQEASHYLARMRALSEHIASAMVALERNDLPQFVASVGSQQASCDELSQSPFDKGTTRSLRPKLMQEIEKARTELARLNRIYSALLQRSQRTVTLITGLYRGYSMGYERDRALVAESHTWSCEV
jgi:hypothetical protein